MSILPDENAPAEVKSAGSYEPIDDFICPACDGDLIEVKCKAYCVRCKRNVLSCSDTN